MFSERLKRLVGGIALLGIVGAASLVLMRGDRPLTSAVHFTVLFDRVGRLRPGAAVRMNNLEMGRVAAISFAPGNGMEGREPVGRVRVSVWIKRKFRKFVRRNSRFIITATSLVGARHLEVLPPKGEPGPMVRNGDVLKGEAPARMDRMLWMSYENLKRSTELIRKLDPDISKLDRELKRLDHVLGEYEKDMESAKAAYHSANEAIHLWRVLGRDLEANVWEPTRARTLARKAGRLTDEMRDRVHRSKQKAQTLADRVTGIRKSWSALPLSRTVRHLEKFADHLRSAVAAVRTDIEALRRIYDSGSGTLGALAHDRQLWDDFKENQRTLKHRIWTLIGRPKENSPEGYPTP